VHLFGNGKYLASGGLGGILRVFDLETGTLVRELIGHTSSINFIATCRNVFGDGTYKDDVLVTAGDDSTIKVWNPMTGELVRDLADIHQDMEINTLNVIPTQWCGDITPNRAPIIASAGDEKIVFLTYLDEKNHHSLPNLEVWQVMCALLVQSPFNSVLYVFSSGP
jgi:WD40 repeat protein